MSKEDFWQQHIAAWKKSGLSQQAFCQQHDIKPHNLHYWRKRLAASVDQPKALIPINVIRSANARLQLGSQVSIELPAESLPDLLLALRDRGLLHVAA